jgi:predicted transcriptional regulator
MANDNIINPKFENFGWISRVQKNQRGTFRLTLNRMVALGCDLQRGQKLYCYLAKDSKNRPILVIYLDGKPRNSNGKCKICHKNEIEERGICRACKNGVSSKYSDKELDDVVDRFNGKDSRS